MIFAVHIGSNSTAQGDVARARRDWQKPAFSHHSSQNGIESGTRFGTQNAGVGVEAEKSVKAFGEHRSAVRANRGIAIGTTHAAR